MPDSRDISIVIPTVDSRKEWLDKTLEAYENTAPGAEIVVVRDEPSCGEAWITGHHISTRPYVHFTADDIIPHPEWWEAPLQMLDEDVVPICNVFAPDGRPEMAQAPLGALGQHLNVMVPFLTREMLDTEDEWLLPVHYGSDMWVTYWAAHTGRGPQWCEDYRVTHYLAPEGRVPYRQGRDMAILIKAMDTVGYIPPYYVWYNNRIRLRRV